MTPQLGGTTWSLSCPSTQLHRARVQACDLIWINYKKDKNISGEKIKEEVK